MWTRKDWISNLGFGAVAIVACALLVAANEWGRPPEPAILPKPPAITPDAMQVMPVITPGVPMTDEEVDERTRKPLWPEGTAYEHDFLAHPPLWPKDE